MKAVHGAQHADETKSNTSRYACFAAVLVGFFFLLSLSSGNKSSADGNALRSGQAKRPTIYKESTKNPTTKGKDFGYGNDTDIDTGSDIFDEDKTVLEAETKFIKAVNEQLALNQKVISKAIAKMMEVVRASLNDLLGDSDLMDATEIAVLGNHMEERLVSDVRMKLKESTDILWQDKEIEIETDVDLDTEGGAGPGDEPVDLKDEEQKMIVQLRDGVDEACTAVKMQIKHMSALVEQELLEVALKKKTKRAYVVDVDDNDTVTGFNRRSSSAASSGSSGSGSGTSSSSSSSSSQHKSSTSSSSSSHHKPSSSSSTHHKPSSSSSHHSSTNTATSSGHKKASSGHKKASSSTSTHHSSSSTHTSKTPPAPAPAPADDEDERKAV